MTSDAAKRIKKKFRVSPADKSIDYLLEQIAEHPGFEVANYGGVITVDSAADQPVVDAPQVFDNFMMGIHVKDNPFINSYMCDGDVPTNRDLARALANLYPEIAGQGFDPEKLRRYRNL